MEPDVPGRPAQAAGPAACDLRPRETTGTIRAAGINASVRQGLGGTDRYALEETTAFGIRFKEFNMRVALFTGTLLTLAALLPPTVQSQSGDDFVPVSDEMLRNPPPEDWLTWRRTLNGWSYSPLDQVNRNNVGKLDIVWSHELSEGRQPGTPLVYGGVMYMPNPADGIQAIDAATGDRIWEYRRERREDLGQTRVETNRNIAMYGELIIGTSTDEHIFALHAKTGEVVWDREILDYTTNPANQTSGPIVANGKAYVGRSCNPYSDPLSCVITAHDATTGEELWSWRLIPGAGEFANETWDDIGNRDHVGSWTVSSYDPELNLVYIGTSVTPPVAMPDGVDRTPLHYNSTVALNGDTGEFTWSYQHLNGYQQIDHPYERLLVDTAVAPAPDAVQWINPAIERGQVRRVMTGIPSETGLVYTLDRATGEFLWARRTVTQNVIRDIDVATGQVMANEELVFAAAGLEVPSCPTGIGGKGWESGAYSPQTNTMYMPLGNTCADAMNGGPDTVIGDARFPGRAPGSDEPGTVEAISVETGKTLWEYKERAATTSLIATGGGLVFGGDEDGGFRTFDQDTGKVLWTVNLGSSVSGFPITYAVDGRQYVAISTGDRRSLDLTSELGTSGSNTLFVFALDPAPRHPLNQEFVNECLGNWQEALLREEHATYVKYLHSSTRRIREYGSEAAMKFWAQQFRTLAQQGFKGQFRLEMVNVDTPRAPSGAVRAYPVLDGGRVLDESLVVVREAETCKILRVFG